LNARVDTAILYYILSIAMSELRARNVKPSKEVKDIKEKAESQVRRVACSGER